MACLPHQQEHPRPAGLLRAGPQGSAVLQLDLISCRNLLIYLGRICRRKLIPAVPLRAEPRRRTVPRHVGKHRQLHRPVCRGGQQSEALPAARRIYWRGTHGVAACRPRFCRPGRHASRSRLHGRSSRAAAAARVTEQGAAAARRGRRRWSTRRATSSICTAARRLPRAAPGEAGVNNILKMAREGLHARDGTALHRRVAAKTVVRAPGCGQNQRRLPRST
jgi:two-component system CheB/CheR fusion protein